MSGWGRVERNPERCVMFTRWVPPPSPHQAVPVHGPDVPANFIAHWPLAIQTAGSFGRVEPDGYHGLKFILSRN
jgi:hypothetical protein